MVTSLLLIGGALITFLNFIRPAYAEVQKLKGEVFVRERFVANEQEAVKKVQQLISAYNNKIEFRNLISLTLPLTIDVSGALAQLAGLVQSDTLGAQSFAMTEEGNSGEERGGAPQAQGGALHLARPLGKLALQVSFTGSYDNIKSFLEKIESNIRVFDIAFLSIVPSGKPNQDLYRVELKVATYYQKEQ